MGIFSTSMSQTKPQPICEAYPETEPANRGGARWVTPRWCSRRHSVRFRGRGTLRHHRAGVGVVLLLALTLVVIAFVLLRGGGKRYEVRALVESAGQLVKGNLVKVGGVTVGSVHAIDL